MAIGYRLETHSNKIILYLVFADSDTQTTSTLTTDIIPDIDTDLDH